MQENLVILLIDDDQDDRKLFFEAVKEIDKGITCIGSSSGLEALVYLKTGTNRIPDFIFLDLRMPGLSGQKCLEEIKKDRRLSGIPVIVYTTSKEVKESIALRKMGAVHFMSKPTSPDEIYYMVSCAINERWD
jgi:DNA-binding NtrC family response regulator